MAHSATSISKTSMVSGRLVARSEWFSDRARAFSAAGSSWAGSCKSLRDASRDKEERHVGTVQLSLLLIVVSFISSSTQHSSRVFLCARTSSFATRTASVASDAATGADSTPIKTSPGTSCLLCDALEFSRPFEATLSSQSSFRDAPSSPRHF